jgi:hypothetical protein
MDSLDVVAKTKLDKSQTLVTYIIASHFTDLRCLGVSRQLFIKCFGRLNVDRFTSPTVCSICNSKAKNTKNCDNENVV